MTPSEEQELIKELKTAISKELTDCCNKDHLPRLKEFISTPEGMERAEDMVYSMCANDGIAVQTAMSNLDSDL